MESEEIFVVVLTTKGRFKSIATARTDEKIANTESVILTESSRRAGNATAKFTVHKTQLVRT